MLVLLLRGVHMVQHKALWGSRPEDAEAPNSPLKQNLGQNYLILCLAPPLSLFFFFLMEACF